MWVGRGGVSNAVRTSNDARTTVAAIDVTAAAESPYNARVIAAATFLLMFIILGIAVSAIYEAGFGLYLADNPTSYLLSSGA
jgi:hypothetical protein